MSTFMVIVTVNLMLPINHSYAAYATITNTNR